VKEPLAGKSPLVEPEIWLRSSRGCRSATVGGSNRGVESRSRGDAQAMHSFRSGEGDVPKRATRSWSERRPEPVFIY